MNSTLRSLLFWLVLAIVAVVAVAVGEGLAPISDQEGLRMKSEALSGQVTLASPYGFWARDGQSFVNIRQILPGADLRDISIYEVDEDRHLTIATRAARARYVSGGWVLEDVAHADQVVKSRTFDRQHDHMSQADQKSDHG